MDIHDKDYIEGKIDSPQGREELCKEFEEVLNLEFDKYVSAWNKVLTGTGEIRLYVKPSRDGIPILRTDKHSVPVFDIACQPVVKDNGADRYLLFGERAFRRAVFSLQRQMSNPILETIIAAGYDINEADKSKAVNSVEGILALEGLGIKGKLLTTKIECVVADIESVWNKIVDGDDVPEGVVIEERPDLTKGYYTVGKIGHIDYLEMGVAIAPKNSVYTLS